MHNSLIRIDDKLASRGCQHMNLIVAQLGDTQVIFQFGGESIPGLLQVINTQYTKDGKWSHYDWLVEAQTGVSLFKFSQDWGTGAYLPEGRWAEARQNFRRQAGTLLLDDEAIDRFIRARLPDAAAHLDAEEALSQGDPTQYLLDIYVQQEIAGGAAKLAALGEVAKRQAEAQELARRMAREEQGRQAALTDVKAKLAGGKAVSLADLKAIMNSGGQGQWDEPMPGNSNV